MSKNKWTVLVTVAVVACLSCMIGYEWGWEAHEKENTWTFIADCNVTMDPNGITFIDPGDPNNLTDDSIRRLCKSGRVCAVMGHQWTWPEGTDLHGSVGYVGGLRCGLCGKEDDRTIEVVVKSVKNALLPGPDFKAGVRYGTLALYTHPYEMDIPTLEKMAWETYGKVQEWQQEVEALKAQSR